MSVFVQPIGIGILLALLSIHTEAMVCFMGQEPDLNARRYRWVIPVEDPCKCTEIRPGGINNRTPGRHFKVIYFDTFLISNSPKEIRKWLNCSDAFLGNQVKTTTTSSSAINGLSIVGRPASQSSDYIVTYKAELAADGNMDTIQYPNNACASTQEEMNPWWKVALDGEHCVTKVTLLNRGDCCSDRLEGAVVRAGTSENVLDNPVCGSPVTSEQAAPLGGNIDIVCDRPLVATYISVNIPTRQILQLCEVMVQENGGPC